MPSFSSDEPSLDLTRGFSPRGLHGLVHKDEFCPFAGALRDELLHFPAWTEMTQDSAYRVGAVEPRRQNGITTGHLVDEHRAALPRCLEFRDWLHAHCGLQLSDLGPRLEQVVRRRQAHLAAPEGTVFTTFAPGPAWCIVVLDERGRVVYLGPADGYRPA